MLALGSITLLILAHLAVLQGFFNISYILLTIALANMFGLALCNKIFCNLMLVSTGILLAYFLLEMIDAKHLTYYPPILINGSIFLFIGSSLRRNKTPVITRFALLIDGEITLKQKIYCRHVSAAWAVLMFIILIETIVLAFFFPIEIWSLFVNLINYLLILVMFLAEFMVRRIIFKYDEILSFSMFLKSLEKVDVNKIFRSG